MVTGGNGFIGSATIRSMLSKGIYSPVATVRKHSDNAISNCQVIEIDDLQNQTDWKKHLENIDVILNDMTQKSENAMMFTFCIKNEIGEFSQISLFASRKHQNPQN